MSDLDNVVEVTVTADGTPLSRQGFGTMAIVTAQGAGALAVETFTSLAAVGTAYGVDSPRYRSAQAAFSQSPRPKRIKFIDTTLAVAQSVDVVVQAATDGTVTSLKVYYHDGTTATFSQTASSQTTTQIATALAASISSGSTIVSASGSGATITITNDTDGQVFFVEMLTNLDAYDDNTADPGYAAQLTSALTLDADWYGLCVDVNSEAIVDAVAAWAEANEKLFIACVADGRELGASGTIGSGLVSSAYERTALLWHSRPWQYAGVAWMAARLVDPDQGQQTWAFATLAGITVDEITPTQRGYLDGDRTNFYVELAGRNVVLSSSSTLPGGGFVASGEWIDVVHGTDWLRVRIQEDIATLVLNAGKLPYTQGGIDAVGAALSRRLKQAERLGFLLADSSSVSVPNLADVSAGDRQARILNDVTASARYASAIHKVALNVSLSY